MSNKSRKRTLCNGAEVTDNRSLIASSVVVENETAKYAFLTYSHREEKFEVITTGKRITESEIDEYIVELQMAKEAIVEAKAFLAEAQPA